MAKTKEEIVSDTLVNSDIIDNGQEGTSLQPSSMEENHTGEASLHQQEAKVLTIREDGSFDFRGKQYSFAPDAPELILFGGEGLTQEEIVADEDVLVQLIGGGSALIVRSE